MKLATHRLLCEALRRYDHFDAKRDGKAWTIAALQNEWTGLGYETEYRPAVAEGYMRRFGAKGAGPRWWSLTRKGACLVLSWHNQGYTTDASGVLVTKPPFERHPTNA